MFEFHLPKKFKNLKVSRRKEIELQEIFLDSLAEEREEEIGITENKLEVPLSRGIIFLLFVFFLFCIIFLFSQTFYFQIVKGSEFSAQAKQNKFAMSYVNAERGVIYDSKGVQLVFNKPSFNLVATVNQVINDKNKLNDILGQLADILNLSTDEIKQKLNQDGPIVTIAENLDHNLLVILETKIDSFEGFSIQNDSTRFYQDGPIYSSIIGYTGKTNINYAGKDGIEKSYENSLKENLGAVEVEKDVYGNLLSKKVISNPESGNSLVLWLDSELQKKAVEELTATLEKTGAKKGVVIAMNPKTGGILSLVNIPSYDNNLFTKGADQQELNKILKDPSNPMLNRAIAGLYSSGSTIKPILATGALEEKLINPNKDISCTGAISVPNKYDPTIIYTYKDNATHGPTNMRKAIAESCNVYFFTIGGGYGNQTGLGPARIKKYLELFGWGNITGIDLPGETDGFIPTPTWKQTVKKQPWSDGDTYNISIGQGDLLVTPIQVVSSFSAIANGGILYKPQIVKEVINGDKQIVQEIKPEILNASFVDNKNLQVVREGMRMGVTAQGAFRASSFTLNTLPVPVAAKTGTAETSRRDVYQNWVTVFAPYDDPQIVLTVLIENVPGIQAAALPTAKGILEWYFTK
jgi:penicillin-binding protein 2